MGWLENNFGKWVIKKRWWIIFTTILIVFAAASGTRFLTINNDTRVFFSKENPQLQALEALENTYSKSQSIFFILAPKDKDIFTPETLAIIEELTEVSWKIPYSSRVNSITNFQYTKAVEDDLIVEDLVRNPSKLLGEELKRIKEIAISEPHLVNLLISPTAHVAGVNVNVLQPGKSPAEISEMAEYARKIMEDFKKRYPDIDFYLTGSVIFDHAFGEASRRDMSTLTPIMFLVLVVIAGIALRSFAGTFSTLMVIIMSMLTGMGLGGWFRIAVTAASANAPQIILTLAVADSIHILVTMFQQMRSGKSKNEAIIESLRINLQPVFLTSITTAIGFLSMNFSDAPPFRDLGNVVAMGVMAAFLYSVFFLPALIAVLPVRTRSKSDQSNCPACDRLADFVINRRRPVFWSMIIIIITLTAGIFRIELHDDWIKYFGKSYDIRKATDFAEENLTGFHLIEYSLESGETGGINSPAYLRKVEEFASWYRKQPKVINVNVITNTMKRLNKNMHGDDESYYRIPEKRDLAAQYLLLYEMSLPFGLDLNNRINVDKSATRMVVTLRRTTTNELRATDKRARQWLKDNAPESMFTYGSGLSIIWAHISERNINSMLGASLGALILISFILIIALRNIKLGAVSLIPNLAPAFIGFGIWGLTMRHVGLALSVIAAMTLGIVVDDTIHFISKYLRARKEYGMDQAGAVRFSFHSVGTAMWVTTLILVAGFMVLFTSDYKMNSDIGLLSAITITIALVMDFLLLPTLLMRVDKETYKSTT